IWPSVKIKISTRNGSLYTKIKSNMPIITSDLLKSKVNKKAIKSKLNNFRTKIKLIQTNSNYTL
ncbi:transporter, partial [Lysinibacillus agricola]